MRHAYWSVFALFFLLLEVGASFAQTADCGLILTRGLREYDIQNDSSSYLNTTFDSYCSASGQTRDQSLNIGLDAVVEAIPIKFTLGAKDARSAMENFCKVYKSDTSSRSDTSRYRETIVRRAYDSYDNCIRLSMNGNVVTHDVLSLESTQIFLKAGVGKPVELRGIKTSSNITCTGANSGKILTYGEATAAKTGNVDDHQLYALEKEWLVRRGHFR